MNTIRHLRDPVEDVATSAMFFRRVERLARESSRFGSVFHRTRMPFIRLPEIWGHLPSSRVVTHPAHCDESGCGAELIDRYFRRADGWVLCPTCFFRRSGQD